MASLIRAFNSIAVCGQLSSSHNQKSCLNMSNRGLRYSVVQPLGQKKGVVAEVWISCTYYQVITTRLLFHTVCSFFVGVGKTRRFDSPRQMWRVRIQEYQLCSGLLEWNKKYQGPPYSSLCAF
ncbi:unnamed protein product [Ectocarpus sp. 4 AP-2014]